MGKLSEMAIKKAKPEAKAYKMADGGGMYLLVQPTGAKWWRMKYRIDGKEKMLSIGTYPDITLSMRHGIACFKQLAQHSNMRWQPDAQQRIRLIFALH